MYFSRENAHKEVFSHDLLFHHASYAVLTSECWKVGFQIPSITATEGFLHLKIMRPFQTESLHCLMEIGGKQFYAQAQNFRWPGHTKETFLLSHF